MKKRPRSPSRPEAASLDESPDSRLGAILLWASLAVLVVSRGVSAFLPSMWAWSLNLQRFMHPVPGWGLWAVAAAALIPAVAARGAPPLESAGRWMARHPGLAYLAWGFGAAGLVLLLPDRTQFVGDFLLRQGTLREGLPARTWYPQAMPLDLMIHDRLASGLMLAFRLDANATGRAIGAAEAAILGALAVRLARVLDLRGAAAFAVSSILLWGGYLTLFTGYNKAFSEMCVLTAAVGVFGLDVVRRGRGLAWLGLALALAILVHRSAIGLVPAAAVGWVACGHRPPARRSRRPDAPPREHHHAGGPHALRPGRGALAWLPRGHVRAHPGVGSVEPRVDALAARTRAAATRAARRRREMGRGDFGAARSVFERMVSGNPRDAFAWWGYALASMNLGAWPEAHRAASRAAELDSTNQAARQAMLQLEQAHPDLAASPR